MLKSFATKKYKKAFKLAEKQKKDLEKLEAVLMILSKEKSLPVKYRNHKLKGKLNEYWECHIEPDWLLIYYKTETEIVLVDMGSHSDLFSPH